MTDEKQGVKIPVRRKNNHGFESQPEDDKAQVVDGDAAAGNVVAGNVEEQSQVQETACAEWRDTALRLKAEMINYRRRQDRWAQDEVQREKDRLLLGFVGVLDDMEQAMAHLEHNSAIHQAVQIAYNNMLKLLVLEDVVRIDALGAPFDPQWHDAVVMAPAPKTQKEPLVVIEVVGNGYRIGDRLLKPARVVVSKRD